MSLVNSVCLFYPLCPILGKGSPRFHSAMPPRSDNTLGCYRECSGESPRVGLTPGPEHFG
jgi:hypothetical protein